MPAPIDWFRNADWLNRERAIVYPRVFLVIFAAWMLFLLFRWHWSTPTVFPIGADFCPFWTGSSLALGGHPAAAYHKAIVWKAEKALVGPDTPFDGFPYPPPGLAMVLPLALIPYNLSLLIWSVIGLWLYLRVMERAAGDPDSLWAALIFPGAILTILNGQNGFFTTALLGGGLLMLEERPWAAGACFGLMCFKPQFGILLPLVLMVDRRWRVVGAAAATVAICAAVSTAMFGLETWRAFFASIPDTTHRLLELGIMGYGKMQSTFAGARLLGLSLKSAYAIQALVSLAAGATVVWMWSRPVGLALKASALIAGILLVTPYVLDYDLVLLAIPIAWMYADGIERGFLPWEKFLLFLFWLYPLFARMLGLFASIPLTPVVVASVMALIVRRALADSLEDAALEVRTEFFLSSGSSIQA